MMLMPPRTFDLPGQLSSADTASPEEDSIETQMISELDQSGTLTNSWQLLVTSSATLLETVSATLLEAVSTTMSAILLEDMPASFLETASATSEMIYPKTIEFLSILEEQERIVYELVDIIRMGLKQLTNEDLESEFSDRLLEFVNRHHNGAIDAIEFVIKQGAIRPDLVSDILYTIGESEDAHSHKKRLALLIENLSSDIPRLRYGAMMGISELKDTKAIPFVAAALSQEKDKILKSILDSLLKYLNET